MIWTHPLRAFSLHRPISIGVLDAGIDFLQKPFSLEALGRKVSEVLDRDGSRGD